MKQKSAAASTLKAPGTEKQSTTRSDLCEIPVIFDECAAVQITTWKELENGYVDGRPSTKLT